MSLSSEQVALSSSVALSSNEGTDATNAAVVLPKALPDVDDVSMNQVSKYVDYYRQDVYWSFLSDSFFVAGGICYVILSCPRWNLVHPRLHIVLNYAAPTVYLLNSFVDVKWAEQVKKRTRLKNDMTETWNYWKILVDGDDDGQDHETEARNQPRRTNQVQPWYIRLRKHAAHRRTLLAAWTFGIAAFFSVLAVIANHINQSPQATLSAIVFDGISVHVYILSAIITVSGKRNRPWLCIGSTESGLSWLDNPETLEDLGDILFLMGSLVDGVLCDFTFDDNRPGWAMTSACLWLVDACLYLKADYILASRMNDAGETQGESSVENRVGLFV